MFKTALVAIEMSQAESPMLSCASELGALGVKRLILLHVVEVGYVRGVEYGHEETVAERLSRLAESLVGDGFEVDTEVRDSGDVPGAILETAADHGADLIVIGSRGRSLVQDIFLGSVAREVIRRSDLPVRLEWLEATEKNGESVCERICDGTFQRPLVATDFSPRAAEAERAAAMLAPRAETVDLLHVMTAEELARYTRWPVMARAALDNIGHEVAAAGGRAEIHLAEGTPSAQIARAAADRNADVIVVGKHGQGWLESLVIGSTAAKLCETARRPVLIMPLASRET